MKTAAIISIGDELLNGQIVDTNSTFLCERLRSCGIIVRNIYTIADDVNDIVRVFHLAAENSDIIISTGGLGPTRDDLTRQALAEFTKSELILDETALEDIHQYFLKRNRQMPPSNETQALLPRSAERIKNNWGTAPGIKLTFQDKLIFALPGVPEEMKNMFNSSVINQLKAVAGETVVLTRKLKCFGISESHLTQLLGPMTDRDRNPLISTIAQYGIITINITATADTEQHARQVLEDDEQKITDLLGKYIFAFGEDTLQTIVGRYLREHNLSLSVAESCTGGLLSKLLTDIPGASDYFKCSWTVYSNQAKIELLKIPSDIIEQHGAVSEPTARAMATAAMNLAGTDYGIGITGIAGPAGATPEKPVGLVFIGLADRNSCIVEKHIFPGDRTSVRFRAALTALNMLRLKLANLTD